MGTGGVASVELGGGSLSSCGGLDGFRSGSSSTWKIVAFLGYPRGASMRTRVVLGVLSGLALLTQAGVAAAPNVKGKIIGQDKLVPEVYSDAAKPDARRWTWREPSPSVDPKFRTLAANPSRDICIAATSAANQEKQEHRMTVTGGRVFPTTIVVTPKTGLVFKNFDPFSHRIYIVNANGQKVLPPADLAANQTRTWSPDGAGKFEVRDELFPSVRTYVVVDPQVAAVVYPGRDGAFGFSLPGGDYVLKAFFNGRQIGKPVPVVARERGAIELAKPLDLADGAEAKP